MRRTRTRAILVACLILLGCKSCSGLSFGKVTKKSSVHTSIPTSLESKPGKDAADGATDLASKNVLGNGLRAAALSASLMMATMTIPPVPAAHAAVPTLNEAIVELSETSYPVLRQLDAVNFQAFSVRVGELLLEINPSKLGKSIDLGIDVLDSAPAEQLESFNTVLRGAFTDVGTDSCTLVPLPPMSIVDRFATVAADTVDAEKLKTFRETWQPSLDALPKTSDDKICLPPTRASLDKLALAQADLGRSFGKAETKAFASYTGSLLKTSIPQKKLLPLVDDVKTLAPRATPQVKKDFAVAGKKAETASKLEIARNKVAEQKAKAAANKAALSRS
mmetsp:Transcript_184/g.381  ORF Transcript_184/g.381 Transcript_184/m.381 type:complete len:335 (+) Transcript_184:153-1157(+)